MLWDRCLSCLTVSPVCNVGVLWPKPNVWMNQNTTWYGGRPRTRRRCVRWGPISPHGKGHSLFMRFQPYFYFRFGHSRYSGVVYRLFAILHQISYLSTLTASSFDVKPRSPTLFPVLRKPEVVFNGQTVADRSIHCIKVEQEVEYCDFVYAVSAVFLLPIWA